jgi:hypothetical protein
VRLAALVAFGACASAPAPPAAAPANLEPPTPCAPYLIATGEEVSVGDLASITFRRGAQLVLEGREVAPREAPAWRVPIGGAAQAQLASETVISPGVVALAGASVVIDDISGDDVEVSVVAEESTMVVACADLAERRIDVVTPEPRNPRRLSDEVDLVVAGEPFVRLPAGSVVDVLHAAGPRTQVRAVLDDVVLTGSVPCSAVPDVPCVETRRGSSARGFVCGGALPAWRDEPACAGDARLRAGAPLWTSPWADDRGSLPPVDRALDVRLVDARDDLREVELVRPIPDVDSATAWVFASDLDRETCR